MIKLNVVLAALVFALFSHSFAKSQDRKDHIWYKQAALKWEEALPLGNGRIGAMVFGNPVNERIQLNDDSMWPANTGWDEPAGNKNDLQRIRELLFEGNNQDADKLFVEKFSRKDILRSHQTLGDLFIDLEHSTISGYSRQLDIRKAIATSSYLADGKAVTQKVFVSHPHRVIVIELASEGGLNGKIKLLRPADEGHPTATTKSVGNNTLVMNGQVTQYKAVFDSKPNPITSGVKFETRLKALADGGEIIGGTDYLVLKNVQKLTIYLANNTSFYYPDYSSQSILDIEIAEKTGIEAIERDHIADYQKLFDRVDFYIQADNPDTLATNERIARVKAGQVDLGLEVLLFQYGRYLLISSSRPGTNPANLQGLWNQHLSAPWNADYHLNINLQMNYWPANLTNLDELNMPLFGFIDRLIENGKQTAKINWGCRGTFFPHATDIWAQTWLQASTAYWGCSVGAGGWLIQHYWQHYQFTRDKKFLKQRAFPAMHQVALFYSDWLITDKRDGYLISAPSTSPENQYTDHSGKQVATCLGSAMDQQIIAEVFDNYIQACQELNIQSPFLKKIKQQRKKLRPGFVLASDGRILEWDREYAEPEPGHRHMSHLYGFHPGVAISKDKTPELFEAVRKSLDYRLENGGAGTGWSRAWLINCSARLLDGNMAHDHIQLLLQKSIYDNLFDAHPPFQIDGNFGYTAGIAEMLIQSHEENTIRILPALPALWENGHIKGIKARHGITADIFWKKNRVEKVVIYPAFDVQTHFVIENNRIPVKLIKDKVFVHTN
jgi:alpha-L-fucosidase 2